MSQKKRQECVFAIIRDSSLAGRATAHNTTLRYRPGIEKLDRQLATVYITGCGSCPQARQWLSHSPRNRLS